MSRFSVLVTEQAQLDIVITTEYIGDTVAAARYRQALKQRIGQLGSFAPSLRQRRFPNGRVYRAITFKSHIVFCRVDEEAERIEVVRVFHGASDYRSEL